ncbi:unnamed protein product [Candidula unifasciata]|uniref:HEAT repeat-containing protein 1 n=1 Tax=Candidula unifasciata TaxID=100452 RepID=A0A8S3YQB3_9EUPU|nr:unnamed protein product [Candidula unifasciata]
MTEKRTSLAEQLQKLATPQAQNVLASRDHTQASFLYDSKEAATYERQHFYNIGINGLQQLIARDERFKEFEHNLFSPSSQTLQRFVQTTEVNKMLDEAISKFLLRLSPYMQLREAHKAMEWMVHRYNVHLRNIDDLMMCLLPYHDQEPFIMALRLIRLDGNNCAKWRWLEPVKKGNVFLPRQTLITHCRATKGFLGFMCDMLNKHIEANTDESGTPSARHLQQIISFYTQTVLGVLITGPPSEAILSTLIPVVTSGLTSRDLPDYMVSSYMILSQLFMQTSLNPSLLHSFLNVIAKNAQPGLLSSAVTVIIIMFQKQDICKVSKKAFKYLSRHTSLTPLLAGLSREANTEPFVTPFMAMLAERALKDSVSSGATSESNAEENDDSAPPSLISLLLDMLSSVPLEQQSVAVVARAVLNWYKNKESNDMEVDNEVTEADGAFRVFRLLENKYSEILDTVVEEVTSADGSGEMSGIVRNLFQLSVAAAQKDLTSEPTSCMAVCLYHRQGVVRKTAVERLLQDMTLMDDLDSVQSALAARLQDEDPSVVSAVLGNPQSLWELFVDKSLLYQTLLKKLAALGGKLGRNETRNQILHALCCVPENVAADSEVAVIVLSFLVILDVTELDLAVDLLKSPVTSWNKLLAHVSAEWLIAVAQPPTDQGDEKLLADMCARLVESVASFLMTNPAIMCNTISSMYNSLSSTPRSSSAALVIILVTDSLIRQSSAEDMRLKLQKQLVYMISHLSLNKHIVHSKRHGAAKSEASVQEPHSREAKIVNYLSQLAKARTLSSDILVDVLGQLNLASVPGKLKDVEFWDLADTDSPEDNWLRIMTTAINFLLDLSARKSAAFSAMGKGVFDTFFKVLDDVRSVARFLCMLWMASNEQGVSLVQKAHILQFSQVYFNSLSDSEVATLVNNPSPVLPCLLILLSSPHERVREVAFTILASLARDSLSPGENFKWFANSLLQYRQEVTKDHEFLAQVLKTILEDEANLLSSPAKKRRRTSSKPPPHSLAMTYLLDIITSPLTTTSIRSRLLAVLHKLDTAESFLPLMPLLRQLLAKAVMQTSPTKNSQAPMARPETLSVGEREVVVWLLKRFTASVAGCVEGNSDALHALLEAISCPCAGRTNEETVQMLAVARLKKKFMAALPYSSRQAVLTKLLDVLSTSHNVEVGRSCRKTIKHMAMESSLIVDELKSVLTTSSVTTVREAKRQKSSQNSELDSLAWKRIVILLEMIQSKKKVTNAVLIVPVAFQVLGRVLEIEQKGSGEYIKQLLLGTVHFICSKHPDVSGDSAADAVKGEHLNMDLIVQCIRSSDNPHTHQQALMLLSTAAKISPDLLLHNMMTVFTFMGANILRQDDAYSFHVIGRILENVIPALVMACEEKSRDKMTTRTNSSKPLAAAKNVQSEDMMSAVLRVFVDAIPHIPAHRKIMLFDKLMTVVGAEKYLWRLILLFIESVTVRSSKQSVEEKVDTVPDEDKPSGPVTTSDLEFLTSLCEKFSGPQLLQCFYQAVTYVIQLPEEKQGAVQAGKEAPNFEDLNPDVEIFSVNYHTAKQLRHFKFALVYILNHLVSSQHLVSQLAEMEPSSFLATYQSVMEAVLQFIGQVTHSHDSHKDEHTSRFWRLLLHKSHDLLDHLVNLLPDSMFLDVVLGLMSHSLPLVQRRAMELLNTKLQHYKEGLSPSQVEKLLSITTKLQSIVHKTLLKGTKTNSKDEEVVNGQTALYSLKVLCRILGEKNHKHFIEVLKVCVKVLTRHHDNGVVSATAMLCIAEVVSCVKLHCIQLLGDFMPQVISQLQSEDITRHEVLLLAAVSSLQKIIESVPLFLSPYLLEIIVQICIINSLIGSQADSQKPVVGQKVKLICSTIATVTPTRTFLPVLEKSFMALQDKMASCAQCAMSMLKDHIVKMSKDDLTTFSQDLLKFFFTCFDIRATHQEIREADLDVIEATVIDAFVTLVFKLSEAQFKPMLLQIYGWATGEDTNHDRVLVFYRLCDSLAEKLKNLFTLFAGHFLKHSAEMLDINNKSKNKCKFFGKGKNARRKSCRLLCYIVDCLQKTFSFDTEGFVTKERFDVVMQSLVDQLENTLGKDQVNDDRITNHVVPCLASLAMAAHDDSLWKDMNYQILLKTRHESPKVRIWALCAVDAFHKQLGEDYTQLVPETIPFMAELMEDEVDDVEKYTHKVLAAMEVSVGENLQEYF